MKRAQMFVAAVHEWRPMRQIGRIGHHLRAAGDDEIFHSRHDGGGRHTHGCDAGSAKPIQRNAAGDDVEAGVQRRHATQVGALLVYLRGGAPDDIINLLRIQMVASGNRP
jgi:hypothetical protein